MKTKQSKLGKKLLSLTIMLTTLLTLFAPTSYAYTVGSNTVSLSQVNDWAKTNRWQNVKYELESIPNHPSGTFVEKCINDSKVNTYNLYDLNILCNDILSKDPSKPVFRDAYLQEMHQKGLVQMHTLNLVIRTNAYTGNCYRQYGGVMHYALRTKGSVISSAVTHNGQPVQLQVPPKIHSNYSISWDTGYLQPLYNVTFPESSVSMKINMDAVQEGDYLYAIQQGRFYNTNGYYSLSDVPMYVDLNASTVEVTVLPDTSQVGQMYTTVQQLPTTLNTSLANQPLALVYIPNNAQRTTQLAKLGLATNITTDGIYKSSDGFKYKVVFYTPPSSVDQLNLT